MKKILLVLLSIISISCNAQKSDKYNLGFENQIDENALSDGWIKWGDYKLMMDDLTHSGKKSGKITADANGSFFGSIAYKIPANYKGNTIKLEGFMKIKNVENGFAGLLLRVDGNDGILVFDNMQSQKISGTKDWEKYSITLNYPEEGENIFVAGILAGKGEAWFDDFTVSIDGNDIQSLKEEKIELQKAQHDKEFDNGSSIKLTKLSAENISNLELLGRFRGFLNITTPK